MREQYSRRAVCGAVAAALLGGCVEDEGPGSDPSDNTTQSLNNEQMDSAEDGNDEENATESAGDDNTTPIPPDERQELVDQLPETSPVVGSLKEIVAAADRKRAAETHGYEFRQDDHSVRVAIRLESGATLPSGYRVEVISEYEGYITAHLHVDDVVPLAMESAVRKIQRPAESQTHDGQQGEPRL